MEDTSRSGASTEKTAASISDSIFKWSGLVVAIIGGFVGIGEYKAHVEATHQEQTNRDAENRAHLEATRQEQANRDAAQVRLAEDEAAQRKKEFRVKLYEAQDPLYRQACKAAAQIAIANRWEAAEAPSQKFWELYYGEMCLVETNEVVQAMIAYGEALKRCEQDKKLHAELKNHR